MSNEAAPNLAIISLQSYHLNFRMQSYHLNIHMQSYDLNICNHIISVSICNHMISISVSLIQLILILATLETLQKLYTASAHLLSDNIRAVVRWHSTSSSREQSHAHPRVLQFMFHENPGGGGGGVQSRCGGRRGHKPIPFKDEDICYTTRAPAIKTWPQFNDPLSARNSNRK